MSPKNAPERIAPALMGAGMPSPSPTPISATPIVPIVVHELPREMDMSEHIIIEQSRNHLGESIFAPRQIKYGTASNVQLLPENLHRRIF